MAKQIELRRHTDNEGDVLTPEGVEAALQIGRDLTGGYDLLVSTGAQRATQTLGCFACVLEGQVPGGVVVESGLFSDQEDRWRDTYQKAGSGELDAMRAADPDFVQQDAQLLGDALRRVLERLEDGARALVVGHSPTTEAALLGLTGEIVAPISKGEGVLLSADGGDFTIQPLE